jgi:hypothetical protein
LDEICCRSGVKSDRVVNGYFSGKHNRIDLLATKSSASERAGGLVIVIYI